jgi:hypothetical protein
MGGRDIQGTVLCTALLDRSRLVDDTAAVVRLRSIGTCLPFGMHFAESDTPPTGSAGSGQCTSPRTKGTVLLRWRSHIGRTRNRRKVTHSKGLSKAFKV